MPLSPRRLRVLFVINHVAAYGGAERFAAGLATHMPATGSSRGCAAPAAATSAQ